MTDIMSPLPAGRLAAVELARLDELLPNVERHMVALGVDGGIAGQVGIEAHNLRRTIQRAREAALREIARSGVP